MGSRAMVSLMATADPVSLPDDPILAAIARAPRVQRLTAEQRAELDQAMEDIAAGRVKLVPNEDVPAWLEEHARELGELRE
jgi:predicted transcriptional regulator